VEGKRVLQSRGFLAAVAVLTVASFLVAAYFALRFYVAFDGIGDIDGPDSTPDPADLERRLHLAYFFAALCAVASAALVGLISTRLLLSARSAPSIPGPWR
jgi:hypothetical protein